MPIDIQQFLPMFIEETMEILHEAEKTLLSLNSHSVDPELINRIFRFMHTIKGTSAVFNYNGITDLTHSLENFLDQVRSEKNQLTQGDIDLLLSSVDVIRTLLADIQSGQSLDMSKSLELKDIFEKRAHKNPAAPLSTPSVKESTIKGWSIFFTPKRNFFQMGNEPLRLFQVLAGLGKLITFINIENLPLLPSLQKKDCYLKWRLNLYTETSEKEIKDIFGWVVDEEDLIISPLPADIAMDESAEKNKINTPPGRTLRVPIEKIDNLVNSVGELIITQSIINQVIKHIDPSKFENLYENLSILESNSRELQAHIMRIRMVPIDYVFNRFQRLVHDIAKKMQKNINLIISGEQTEIDKNMIEKITDPLLHLIRNAVDHGIEVPEERTKKGKTPIGVIQLKAYQEGGEIVIEIKDDGEGLNKDKILEKATAQGLINAGQHVSDTELYQYIFLPGFSTSNTISEISGRGVGLDVVHKNIKELGGEIAIESIKNEGTTFLLRLPLTLAIMDCQFIKINEQIYIIPLIMVAEIIQIDPQRLNSVSPDTTLYHLRDDFVEVIYLKNLIMLNENTNNKSYDTFLIIVEIDNQMVGLVVDEILTQQQVVIKNLEDNYKKIPGISGVTITGEGRVVLILDVKAIINISRKKLLSVQSKLNPTETNNNIPIKLDDTHFSEPFHFLSFLIAEKEYGIDILTIKEIRQWEQPTPLPNSPTYIKGVINVRGAIIPIIDLYQLYTPGNRSSYSSPFLIMLLIRHNTKQRCIGIMVDKVINTYTVQYNSIKPLPNKDNIFLRDNIKGMIAIENKIILLWNPSYLTSLFLD